MIETGLPTLRDSMAESSSMSPSMASASLWRISDRPRGVRAAQASNAPAAAATASSTSAASLAGAVPMTSPVAGSSTSSVAPERAGLNSPAMKFWSRTGSP